MERTPPRTLRDLLDRQELHDLVTRYCRAIDRRDGELLRSCYHEDAFEDHGRFKGARDDFVAYILAGHDADGPPLQHAVSNSLFTVDGDVAWGESYVESRSVGPDGEVDRGLARYVDRYERRDGVWRIIHRRVVLERARPGFDLSAFTRGTRDRTDPSYERFA